MKILVVGSTGMLGHKMLQTLSSRFPDTWGTVRGKVGDAATPKLTIFQTGQIIEGVDAMDIPRLEAIVSHHRFDAVINCVGVIKQRDTAKAAIPSITINSLLPHRLAATVAEWGGRVIHFSTDCVFSGRRGGYREVDESDATDLYGKSKFLGEVQGDNALTLRTSIVGRELYQHRSLLDWFLSQRGAKIRGFTRHYWSGVTTNHLSDLVGRILADHPDLHGLYQVSSGKIDKYTLLQRFKAAYGYDVEITPDDSELLDRSLLGDRFQSRIGYEAPTWEDMLKQLLADPTEYPDPSKTSPR